MRGSRDGWSLAVGVGLAVAVGAVVSLLGGAYAIAPIVGFSLLPIVVIAPGATLPLAIAVLLYFVSATDAGRAMPDLAVWSRLGALALCIVVAVRTRHEGFRARYLLPLAVCGIGAYGWAGIAASRSSVWAVDFLGLLVALVALRLLARYVSGEAIGQALDIALLVALFASLLSPLIGWSDPVVGGRLEGIFANANTLGFIAAVSLVRAVFGSHRLRQSLLLLLPLPVMIWSGSRSPLLAVVVAVIAALAHALMRSSEGRRRVAGAATMVAVLGAVVVGRIGESDLALLRTNDSREVGTSYAWQMADIEPWQGIGYAQSVVEIASTPLRWLAETGWPGFALVFIAYFWVFLIGWLASWKVFLAVVFGIVHSLFEGWYFAGGSALFFVHWLLLLSAAPSANGLRRSEADSTAHSHLRRLGVSGA